MLRAVRRLRARGAVSLAWPPDSPRARSPLNQPGERGMPPTAVAQQNRAGNAAAEPPVRLPLFPVGALRSENPDYDVTKTQSATGQVQFDNLSFEPTGWLRGLWFQFDLVT